MNWQQVCEEPSLQNLPFKIELNEYGQVVMSPASNEHGRYQAKIVGLLALQAPDGEVISECSIDTQKGVKVADVVWISRPFLARHGYQTPFPEAPEICVEIISPSNSTKELQEKIMLYFQKGAHEVWVCDSVGKVLFYRLTGVIPHSEVAPTFPAQI